MRLQTTSIWPCIMGVAAMPMLSSCGLKNEIQAAAGGCDEFQAGGQGVAALEIDAKVKAFTQASAELREVSDGIRADVKLACINIAKDLGETDRWSDDNSDSALSNADKTGACDVAASKIDAIMAATIQAGASFALEVSGGQCAIDAEAQASCEAACKADVTCTEATVEVRCPPAELSVQCDAECKAEAVCEGRADVAANCMGKCESECQGECKGELRGTTVGGCMGMCEGKCDGVATPSGGMAGCTGTCEGRCTQPAAGANCRGKCASSCNGKCRGECKLDAMANLNCGESVSCKGGCMGTATQPQCETELVPPVCTGDPNCQSSCSAQASAKMICTPLTVTLIANVENTGDFAKLKTTIEQNLPTILLTFKTKGQLAARALEKVATTGQAVVDASANLGGKAIACAGTAAEASIKASASMSVSVSASANVSSSCTKNSS
jgi:hypothetical protein